MLSSPKKKPGPVPAPPYVRIDKGGCCAISTTFFKSLNEAHDNRFAFIRFVLNKETGSFKFKFDTQGKRAIGKNGFYLSQTTTKRIMELANLPDMKVWTTSIYFTFEEIEDGWFQSKEVSMNRPKHHELR